MIFKVNTFQTSLQSHKEENNDLNKENDEEFFFNIFNVQSSTFFNNHHLSSKSEDCEKYTNDINYDFFHMDSQNNNQKSNPENIQNHLNHSFDFPIKRRNLIVKEKIEMNDPSSYLKNENKAFSATMPQTKSNYILKSELQIYKNGNDNKNSLNKNNNNLLFNYYGNKSNNFTLRNRIVDNQKDKYILDVVNDENDENIKNENQTLNENDDSFNYNNTNFINIQNNENEYDDDNEENNEEDEKNEYISPKDKNAFTLNYLNKDFDLVNKNINQKKTPKNSNNNNTNNNININMNNYNNNLSNNIINNNEMNYNINNNNNQNIYSPIKTNFEDEKINLEIISHAPSFIRDQTGCRLIQKKIDENPSISNNIFESLYYELMTMSTDLFGNYVVQKLLDNINIEKLEKFTQLISIKFNYIATSTYGTRVIQKLLEIVSLPKENEIKENKERYDNLFNILNKMIISNIVSLSSDSNSSHIIIKYVNVVKYPKNSEMFESVYDNFIPLCKDKHGCCVIQKCIEAGINEQKEELFSLSNKYCNQLISDQFGNYVIQYVVGLNTEIINKNIVKVIMDDLIRLCKEKYASNVIEKFLFIKSVESKEIINSIINQEKYLHELIIDQYGNYIVQRILSIVSPDVRLTLIRYIVSWYEEIKSLSFGNRLITKLNERYHEFTSMINNIYGINQNNFNMNNNNNNNKFKNNNSIGNVNFIQMNNYMISNNNNNNFIGLNNNYQNPMYNNNNLYRFNPQGINNNFVNYLENNSSLNYNQLQQMQYQYMLMNYMNNVNNQIYPKKI